MASTRSRNTLPADSVPESATMDVPQEPVVPVPGLIPAKESSVRVEKYSGGYLELDRFVAALRLKFSLDAAYYPTETRKMQYACANLDGAAMDWFVATHTTPQWTANTENFETFVAFLRLNFGDPQPRRTAAAKIRTLRMTTSYQAYQTEFMRISAYLNWGEAALADIFRMGLIPTMRVRMLEHEQVYRYLHPTEPEMPFIEVLRLASEVDATWRATQGERNEQSKNSDSRGGARGNRHTTNQKDETGKSEIKSEDTPGRRLEDVTCYNCNKKGHYSPDCKEPRRSGNARPETS